MRPLLIGESNPYGADPEFALYPAPEGCAGWRLARILGLEPREYLRLFDRCNLLAGPAWSAPRAREAAAALVHPRRVLLGARVAAAHGVEFVPFRAGQAHANCVVFPKPGCFRYLVLPHPSGRSRLWNRPGAAEEARAAVRDLLGPR